jgi:aminoglycoside phosphotransferase (APT) family kinase protein
MQFGITVAPQLRSEADSIPQDWSKLARYLGGRGCHLVTNPSPLQFAGGLANLNYLLLIDGREAVLRRPPLGPLPPGSYDMAREFRILSGLSKGFALAPAAILLGEDPDVIGAPFQIIEFRRGFSVRATLPGELIGRTEVAKRLGETVMDVLVQVANLDSDLLGLGDLGRPEGFLLRTVEGWSKRILLATSNGTSPFIGELTGWLLRNVPPEGATTLLHNDIKLDNILLDGETLEPVALLDWDQGTRGDGLFDLATTLSYWTEANDPPVMHRLKQMPTANPGFPTREQAANYYANRTGRDLANFRFYRVLATFKLAAIFHQLHLRYRQGATKDPRYQEFGNVADGILEFAWAITQGHFF